MFYVLIGVSGCGKTTLGKILANQLGWDFFDGDDFHSDQNISKMSAGIPLNDLDRESWLKSLAELIRTRNLAGLNGVLACSALKEKYRVILRQAGAVKFVYLKGSYDQISQRLAKREDHFMRPELLASQFEALEEPANGLVVEIEQSIDEIIEKIMESHMSKKYSLAILGLGVMGRSLGLNFQRNGYFPIGYDPSPNIPANLGFPVAKSIQELVQNLAEPRVYLLMIPAGDAVDNALNELDPYLLPEDIIIDGGNSHFLDTERRQKILDQKGVMLVGMGISGGEVGALMGPSMMPGGDYRAWPMISEMFEVASAKTKNGQACFAWMGAGGAGHYVKMVHNGIEYADMQLISEIYDLLHRGAEIPNHQLAGVFTKWNQTELGSYLIEITADILGRKDADTGADLLDLILDEATQKGTGKWTSQNSFDLGVAIPTINAAVEARMISSLKEERRKANSVFGGRETHFHGNPMNLIEQAGHALFASKICSFAQGLDLLKVASQEYAWKMNLAEIARVWSAGCIIRASLLNDIAEAYQKDPQLSNLLLAPKFSQAVIDRQNAWRETLCTGIQLGIPMPAFNASLAYFDAYRSETLPANLVQAQRDYFGAHTYRRIDRDGIFHTQWQQCS